MMLKQRAWWVSSLAAILVSLLMSLSAQEGVLTNDDIVKMVRAQLGVNVIRITIDTSNARFDLSPAGLIALKEAGVSDDLIVAMQAKMRSIEKGGVGQSAGVSAREKSDLLANSKDPDVILRSFKTMLVDASRATYFGTAQMKAALGKNRGFQAYRISLVDDPAVADVVLTVNYTFAWDYPFALKHQNTSLILLSGKGSGPFSGPAGAASVASELVKALKPYRSATTDATRGR
jgi:hypothetical protein